MAVQRIRLRSQHNGSYLAVDRRAHVFSAHLASTFDWNRETGIIRHRGRLVQLMRDGTLCHKNEVQDDSVYEDLIDNLYFDGNRIRYKDAVMSCRPNDTYGWDHFDAQDMRQSFDSIIVEKLIDVKNDEYPVDFILGAIDLSVRTEMYSPADARLRRISRVIRETNAGIYVLNNVDPKLLFGLSRLRAFPNSHDGKSQLLTQNAPNTAAIVFDPKLFQCTRAVELTGGGGLIAMMRHELFSFVLINLQLSQGNDARNASFLRSIEKTLFLWPQTRHRIIVVRDIDAFVTRHLKALRWKTTIASSNVRVFARGLKGYASVNSDEIVCKNGEAVRGQVLAEDDDKLRVMVGKKLTWIPVNDIVRTSRGAPDIINPPVVCDIGRIIPQSN